MEQRSSEWDDLFELDPPHYGRDDHYLPIENEYHPFNSSAEEKCTKLFLHDDFITQKDSDHHHQRVMKKFREKMLWGKKGRRIKPFVMNFELVHSLGEAGVDTCSPQHFSLPFDVKISYKCQVILISDLKNHRIQVFHLLSNEYITSIPSPSKCPRYLYVEADYDGLNDALLFGCTNRPSVFKYDLNDILELSMNSISKVANSYIWKSTLFKQPQGIAVCQNRVYVADSYNQCLKVLDSCSGKLLSTIQVESSPYGVCFSPDYQVLYVGAHQSLIQAPTFKIESTHTIFVFQKSEKSQWEFKEKFGHVGPLDGALHFPDSFIIDYLTKHFIVSDSHNHRIVIYSPQNELFKSFSNGQLNNPKGICLNELTGELIVCDHENHRIMFFK
ncbi:hypothetical protein C9374_012997 [Naegleria lovaniensis]|uniref:Uncharacterized protein n=1 Tax=Naegleria lovaniensis TaxID=51637 RepID=A0AA88KHK6_NAELO|nr:uncharacterized protein C9374_012997 [Naegleria lovaniensis]KAG2372967.1 hypothetical protein C9374_012997 [Naegleria lovaniensis]